MKKSFLSATFFLAFRLRQDFGGLACLRTKSALRRAIPAIALAAAGLLSPTSSHAQSPVNVTATVTDPSGIPYANATVSILLLPVGGATVGGNQILTTNNGLLDSNGKLNVSLYKNSDISPGGSTWQFTICETPGIAPPLGTGGVCFTSAQTVSAAVDFSTQFQAAAKALTTIPVSTNFPAINKILFVGPSAGQYSSLQAAHDALPTTGGTVFVMATGTPFGTANTTNATITKSMHGIFDCATFTYSGSAAQAISITSGSGEPIDGCGNANGQPAGATATGGTQIVISNTATNGIDVNGGPGLILRNFTVLGPNSGTGKGIILTANSGHLIDLNVRAWGGNGVEINGTRGNSNNVTLDRVTSVSNGGWGFNVFGANGNVTVFDHTSGSNNALGNYQVATATNVFLGAHSQTSGTGIGVTFLSGGSFNLGSIYSEIGDETTAVAFPAGASNNNISLTSQTAFTNSGTNNTVITNRQLEAGGAVGSPAYSFIGSPTTGLYDLGGGAVGFSSAATASFLFTLNSQRMGANGTYNWSSNADPSAAGNDTGLSRPAAGLVTVGTGAQGSRAGKLASAMLSSDGGTNCTNGELALSAGWQSTGSATVTAAQGAGGQTCMWTLTTGTTTAANPTVTDTLTTALVSAGTVCEMNIHGGTHTAAAGEGFTQTSLSATAPVFTFIGTPTAGGTTYFVTRRCGP